MVSSRKKKERRKDFTKAKLKVGKIKPRSTSHTELGFRAKSVDIRTQSISKTFTARETFNHFLSLTAHSSSSTRKEAIQYLQSHLSSLDNIDASVFNSIAPLILDSSAQVRASLLSLFRSIPDEAIFPHVHMISIFIRSSLTHIDSSIRTDAAKFLNQFLRAKDQRIPMQLVTRSWTDLLDCYSCLFQWDVASSDKQLPLKSRPGLVLTSLDRMVDHLDSLCQFLTLGLSSRQETDSNILFHLDTVKHLPSTSSTSPFVRLGLNSIAASAVVEDLEVRYDILKPMLGSLSRMLCSGRKEGGEVGRLCKTLQEFLASFENAER
ncbi:uncharacterized protein V1516DRAFT_692142 [Lipomyces oligophaga]|uniref:uncharacterized protein n=1 Tax=Lipomyces oligophaga TaxID=45792 RepID=UPI0034CD9B12